MQANRRVIQELDPRLAKYEVQYRLTATEAWQVARARGDGHVSQPADSDPHHPQGESCLAEIA